MKFAIVALALALFSSSAQALRAPTHQNYFDIIYNLVPNPNADEISEEISKVNPDEDPLPLTTLEALYEIKKIAQQKQLSKEGKLEKMQENQARIQVAKAQKDQEDQKDQEPQGEQQGQFSNENLIPLSLMEKFIELQQLPEQEKLEREKILENMEEILQDVKGQEGQQGQKGQEGQQGQKGQQDQQGQESQGEASSEGSEEASWANEDPKQ